MREKEERNLSVAEKEKGKSLLGAPGCHGVPRLGEASRTPRCSSCSSQGPRHPRDSRPGLRHSGRCSRSPRRAFWQDTGLSPPACCPPCPPRAPCLRSCPCWRRGKWWPGAHGPGWSEQHLRWRNRDVAGTGAAILGGCILLGMQGW